MLPPPEELELDEDELLELDDEELELLELLEPAPLLEELEELELLELPVLPPEGTEHSFTPPAIRPPKVASLHTKLPTSTL